jgi:hypothetical protein
MFKKNHQIVNMKLYEIQMSLRFIISYLTNKKNRGVS